MGPGALIFQLDVGIALNATVDFAKHIKKVAFLTDRKLTLIYPVTYIAHFNGSISLNCKLCNTVGLN